MESATPRAPSISSANARRASKAAIGSTASRKRSNAGSRRWRASSRSAPGATAKAIRWPTSRPVARLVTSTCASPRSAGATPTPISRSLPKSSPFGRRSRTRRHPPSNLQNPVLRSGEEFAKAVNDDARLGVVGAFAQRLDVVRCDRCQVRPGRAMLELQREHERADTERVHDGLVHEGLGLAESRKLVLGNRYFGRRAVRTAGRFAHRRDEAVAHHGLEEVRRHAKLDRLSGQFGSRLCGIDENQHRTHPPIQVLAALADLLGALLGFRIACGLRHRILLQPFAIASLTFAN